MNYEELRELALNTGFTHTATAFFFFQDHCCQLQAMPQKTPYVQIFRRK